MRPLLLLLFAAGPAQAAEDADSLLQRLIHAQKQNDAQADRYTYVEEADYFTYDKSGQLHKLRSTTSEIMFIEGTRYTKLVARNGQPLSAREQQRVEKEMRETAQERRKRLHSVQGGWIYFGRQRADLGSLQELLVLFDNRLAGEEEIGGRKAWVVECTPEADRVPANQHEKQLLHFPRKLWIDQADNVLLKEVFSVTGDDLLAKPGSTVTLQFDGINQEVWQLVSIVLDIHEQQGKTVRPGARTEYRNSRFQKFQVESTITVEPPK